jgi:hypothetical protein
VAPVKTAALVKKGERVMALPVAVAVAVAAGEGARPPARFGCGRR